MNFQVGGVLALALAAFMATAALGAAKKPPPPVTTHSAGHRLEFSGATIRIWEQYAKTKPPAPPPAVPQRTFVLTGAAGRTVQLDLHDGGGSPGAGILNLFVADQARYFLIGAQDCIEFDPLRVQAKLCQARPPCRQAKVSGPIYLGRFDWMKGVDPQKGGFTVAFRFLPAEDALESGSCPPDKPPPAAPVLRGVSTSRLVG